MNLILVLLLIIPCALATRLPYNHRYQEGDHIPVFTNTIRCPNHQCEVFPYYDFPFCPPGKAITNRKKSFEEIVNDDCFTNSRYDLKFKVDKIGETLCQKNLTKDEVAKFRYAAGHELAYELSVNNILIWVNIGTFEVEPEKTEGSMRYHLFKHINFHAYYVDNQVKYVGVLNDYGSVVDITEVTGLSINFTYSVFWKELELRLPKYAVCKENPYWKYNFGWKKGYYGTSWDRRVIAFWAAYTLTEILVLQTAIITYLMSYMTRFSNREGQPQKQLHGNGCTCPPYTSLLGAFLGVGTQILLMIFSLFMLGYKGLMGSCNNPELLLAYILSVYCVTSVLSGYTATSFHKGFTSVRRKECLFQTGALYFIPVFFLVLYANALILKVYGISDIPKYSTTVKILHAFVPGTILCLCLGGMSGYGHKSKFRPYCAYRRIPRENTPQQPWYMKTPAQMLIGGLIPFMAIFRQMDELYASLWNRKVCGAFSTMLTAYIFVIMLTIIIAISFTYFQLLLQDPQWWWRSVLRGGSTAIFAFAYGFYFYGGTDAENYGNLLMFMTYNACIFYAFFMALGTIGFYASLLVFRHTFHLQNVQKNE